MRGLNALDFVVIVAYLVGITLLGMWVGRRQRDAKDYFVADREIPWWAVMFSIVASETSALTFISIPGLAYVDESRISPDRGRLPRRPHRRSRTRCCRATTRGISSRRTRCSRQRFGLATRRFTSIVFMVTRGMADSVRVFATAVPIALIIGPLLPPRRGDAGGGARARHADDSLYDPRRHARGGLDGDRAGVGLPHRRHLGDGPRGPSRARRMGRDHSRGVGGGKAQDRQLVHRVRPAEHDVRRYHRRRVSRRWRRTARISSSCSACCRRGRSRRRRPR